MALQMIRCRGRCKQRKAAMMFRPSDLQNKRPICRACRRKPSLLPKQERGAAWRRSARRIFAGAITEGRAA